MQKNTLSWHMPPIDLPLPPDDVHIWRVNLAAPTEVVQRCEAILSPSEQARMQRYAFERDRRRWTIARATLRLLLSRYLHADPGILSFDLNAFGKPSLAAPYRETQIEFNLSHSAEMALYAFTRKRLIGIDIEYMRNDLDYDGMARHSFSPQENEALRSLTEKERHRAFFRGWTCKEAYAKALGKGFSQAFDQFTVSLLPSQPPALLHQHENEQECTRWSFLTLDTTPDYAAALVVEGHDYETKCWLYAMDGRAYLG
jgi:4'-phosphopantetheinyl transferase